MPNDLEQQKQLVINFLEDKSSFEKIYNYFLGDVYRFSFSLVKNKEDAEDITSQVFMLFFQKLENFEWRDVSLKIWLFRTAHNFAMRKVTKLSEDSFDEKYLNKYDRHEISFVDEVINKDLLNIVREEIKNLTPLEQETINLRIWEGLQFDDIAQIQDEKISTCKWRFYNSIDKITKSLDKKKMRSLIPLPLLFAGIKNLSGDEIYKVRTNFKENLYLKTKNMNNTQTVGNTNPNNIYGTSAGLSAKAIALFTGGVVLAIGAGVLIATQFRAPNKTPKDNNPVVVTPTVKITPTSQITSAPTLTSTPTATPVATDIIVTPTVETTSTPTETPTPEAPTLTPNLDQGLVEVQPEIQGPDNSGWMTYIFKKQYINTAADGTPHYSNYDFSVKSPDKVTFLCDKEVEPFRFCMVKMFLHQTTTDYAQFEIDYQYNTSSLTVTIPVGTEIQKIKDGEAYVRYQASPTRPIQYAKYLCGDSCSITKPEDQYTKTEQAGTINNYYFKEGFSTSLQLIMTDYNNGDIRNTFEQGIAPTINRDPSTY